MIHPLLLAAAVAAQAAPADPLAPLPQAQAPAPAQQQPATVQPAPQPQPQAPAAAQQPGGNRCQRVKLRPGSAPGRSERWYPSFVPTYERK